MIRNAAVLLPFLMATGAAFAADPAPTTPPAAPAPAKAAPAAPATPATPAAPVFTALDKNKDKMLTKDEIAAVAAVVAGFSGLDTDKNGSLSEAEYKVWADKAGAAPATPPAAPAPAKAAPAPAAPAPAPKP